MTLLEIMAVVAIIGLLAAMSQATISTFVRTARVNGSGKTLAAMLASARVRAVTTQCPHLVQINGRTYAGLATGTDPFPSNKAHVYLVRKANCASANQQWEVGDHVVDDDNLGPDGLPKAIDFTFPAGVLGGGPTALDAQSVIVGFSTQGVQFVSVDAASGGEGSFAANATPVLTIGVAEKIAPTQFTGTVTLPIAGEARYQ